MPEIAPPDRAPLRGRRALAATAAFQDSGMRTPKASCDRYRALIEEARA